MKFLTILNISFEISGYITEVIETKSINNRLGKNPLYQCSFKHKFFWFCKLNWFFKRNIQFYRESNSFLKDNSEIEITKWQFTT